MSSPSSISQESRSSAQSFYRFIHHNFLAILSTFYLLAAFVPAPGLWLRSVAVGELHPPGSETIRVSLSMTMLAFLLFNAGLGMSTSDLGKTLKRPGITLCGLLANFAVPVILIIALKGLLSAWHNSDELQNLLVGLALIISMPIAGSSTAWSQNANGNLTLSLALVILSTMASPMTTPFILNLFGSITLGDYSSDLKELGTGGTNMFMLVTVVIPSTLGISTHFLLGERGIARYKTFLKLANYFVLLLLNYSNASIALPQAFAKPDWDFLFFIFATTAALCLVGFGSGYLIAKWLKADKSDQASLMFGLGMNNNGTGLVLAASTLSDHPAVFLPMIFYTLVQQLIAAFVENRLFGNEP